MKKHVFVLILAFLIVSILVLYWVSFTVQFNESALVMTFGKISRRVDDPGLQWKLPPPIHRVMKFDRRIRSLERQAVMTQTRDKQPVVATVYVNWRIDDNVEQFYNSFNKPGYSDADSLVAEAENTINDWIAEASNIISEYNLSELVTLDESRFKLDEMMRGSRSSMRERMRDKARAGFGYGIEIMDVGIQMLGVPESVTSKVFARMASEREKERQMLISQGEGAAASIVGVAEGEAKVILADAEAQADGIRAQGDAEALKYLEVLNQNPELANTLRAYKTVSKILGERTTFVFNTDSVIYKILQEGPEITLAETSTPPEEADKQPDKKEDNRKPK